MSKNKKQPAYVNQSGFWEFNTGTLVYGEYDDEYFEKSLVFLAADRGIGSIFR